MKSPADYFKPPIQSTGLQILIIERQCTNVFIKIDRIPEAFFRLFHAARNARITGKVESNHGNLGMDGLRPQQSETGTQYLTTLGGTSITY